eukprot:CAMPEP_0116121994 /NCGR_PEP_ID=MMETSP0329-20121206/3984_1 /TAXON_ID=697910 /ORGANISM="Pseudo-nitzschia arenysensis, Strain B593" /LENGTH=427 /DNA_ID=CAMNT_0003615825 /DNA_START=96 /DNA_END=1379 /DNA_ORIENTATION=+
MTGRRQPSGERRTLGVGKSRSTRSHSVQPRETTIRNNVSLSPEESEDGNSSGGSESLSGFIRNYDDHQRARDNYEDCERNLNDDDGLEVGEVPVDENVEDNRGDSEIITCWDSNKVHTKTTEQMLASSYNSMYTLLRIYVKNNLFKDIKFIQEGCQLERGILIEFENQTQVDYRGVIPQHLWEKYWTPKVRTCFTKMRHTFSIRYAATYQGLKDGKNAKLPGNFPEGVLRVRSDYDTEEEELTQKYELDPLYRKDKEAFFFFATAFVSKINASVTKYKTRCGSELFRDIFTPSDEAFALVLLINELQNYERKALKKTAFKPFTSSSEGVSWNPEGRKLYSSIYNKIVTMRKEDGTKEMEEELRQSFCKAKPRKRTRREEDDFDVNGETLDPDSLAYRIFHGSQPVYKKPSEKTGVRKLKASKKAKQI